MILDDLVAATRIRLARHQQRQSLTELKRIVAHQPPITKSNFLTTLKQPGLHVIAEVKKSFAIKRNDRGGFSLYGDCSSLRTSRRRCYFRPH